MTEGKPVPGFLPITKCPLCKGRGYNPNAPGPCPDCLGTGVKTQ